MIITGKDLLEVENLEDVIEDGLSYSEYQNFDGRIHASSSGYCARRGALEASYKGEKDISAKSTLYFKLGIALEESILAALDIKKKLLFRQYHLPETPINLGGKVDGIIVHNGKFYCLEIKSCGTLPSKPEFEHIRQLAIYSAVTGLPGILLYVSRTVQDYHGNLKIKAFDMGYDMPACKHSFSSAALAYFSSKNGLLPDIPTHITKIEDCGYCYFKDLCWNGDLTMSALNPMTESEVVIINETVQGFIDNYMSIPEIKKRRNGVLKYLSESGNKTSKMYLKDETWDSFLIEY